MVIFSDLIEKLIGFGSLILSLLIVLISVVFIFNIYKYIQSPPKDKKFETVMWNIIALFVLFSVFGIVYVIESIFIP